MEAETRPGCEYTQLNNGIHQFVFFRPSKEAIDGFFHDLEHILETTPGTETARYVLDIVHSEGEISLVANVQRFRKLEVAHPRRARGRTVILHKPGLAFAFMDGFIRALAPSRDKTRFFPIDRREEALVWLMSED